MTKFIDKRLFRYEGKDVIVRSSFENKRFKAWFDGDEANFKQSSDPNRAVAKLWNARRKADGKTTQSKYTAPKGEQLKMLPIKQRLKKQVYSKIIPANDPKPLTKKKVKAFDKPPNYAIRSIDQYRPAKVSQHRRGPPTTSKMT